MTFTESWFFPADCDALTSLATATNDLTGAVIEVGCWEGRSTIALANAIHPTTLHAVDTWQGSPGEISHDLAAERDVFATFSENIENHTAGNVDAHRMGWREFFDTWHDPIRLIHIDATHSYAEVHDNILAVKPFIVPGGVICGDDVQHEPVRDAVWDTLGNAGVMPNSKVWHWRRNG